MAINSFMRNEMKFILDEYQYESLLNVLENYMNPDAFCVNGKEYGVYNVYYDTNDSFLIRESLAKPYYKEKLRLRSYSSPVEKDELVFLEIKKKIGGIVAKRRINLTLSEANSFIFDGITPKFENSKKNYIQYQVLNELVAFLKNYAVVPKQYISYQRLAYFGKDDKNFRLTFDRMITTRRFDVALDMGNYGTQVLLPNQHLMEVKIVGSMPMWLSHELARLQIYKTSFSKYGAAYKKYQLEKVQNKLLTTSSISII